MPYTSSIAGDGSGFDAAREASWIVGRQIDCFAADPSDDAVAALDRLVIDYDLSSYRDRIRHARAGQRRARREAAHHRPNLAEVVATLRNGPPANAADLFEFVLDHLANIRRELKNTATDRYKAFWNKDSHGRPQTPKVEESGRNRLLELSMDRLERHGVLAEPEGRMADGYGCDCKIAQGARTLPIEIKRHYHDEVWSALHE